MKKISAAFDGLKFSTSTLDYALYVVRESGAVLSGIFLEDFLYHSYDTYPLVKAGKKEALTALKDKELLKRVQAESNFEDACKKEGLDYIVHHDKGFAVMDLLKETVYSDLLLIGANETLDRIAEKQPSVFLQELLEGTQCPVMIVPSVYRPIEKLVLLYDGKPSSIFAIKMFGYLLPSLQHLPVEIVTVSAGGNEEELPEDILIKEFLKLNYPTANTRHLTGDSDEKIPSYIKNIPENSLVVLGAYERGPLSRWFRTSMADRLLKEVKKPLFIAHCKQ